MVKTDIFFCHGGASSTREGILYEVPMIMIPQDFDQAGNAQLIKEFQIGSCIHREVSSTPNFESAFRQEFDQ